MNKFKKEFSITKDLVHNFGHAINDFNPVHFDSDYAKDTIFKKPIAHGMLTAGLISGYIVECYGEGSILKSTELNFIRPVYVNSNITIEFEPIAIVE